MADVGTRQTGAGRAGLTFVEMAVIGSIMMVASSVVAEFFRSQADFVEMAEVQADVEARAQLALEQLVTELRHGTRTAAASPPNVSFSTSMGTTTLTLYRPLDLDGDGAVVDAAGAIEWDTVTPIQYQFLSAGQQLQRVAGAQARVIANDVTSVMFFDQATDATLRANEVKVQLTLERRTHRGRLVASTVSAVVNLRN